MPTVEHARMREDDDTSGNERRREIPLAPALQSLERSAFSHLVVLGAIEGVDPLLELLTVEGHFRTGVDAFAFRRLLALIERDAAASMRSLVDAQRAPAESTRSTETRRRARVS
jgi:hypothetical protein